MRPVLVTAPALLTTRLPDAGERKRSGGVERRRVDRNPAGRGDAARAGHRVRAAAEFERRAGIDRESAGMGPAGLQAQRAAVDVDRARVVEHGGDDVAGGRRRIEDPVVLAVCPDR